MTVILTRKVEKILSKLSTDIQNVLSIILSDMKILTIRAVEVNSLLVVSHYILYQFKQRSNLIQNQNYRRT